ncbi:MAG: tRNA pseudouridine(55) synthase TruB [Anaerolineae bacterium]|nr:tRNA pseudouridine(55) synthase TruB [Anaerolineae bacterium]
MAGCENCPKHPTQPPARYVAPKREVPLTGILNVDKPPGLTSHDVVDVIRRVTGQRKVGHAGTLDPMATGVLLVCLGQATRVAEYLMAGRKRYRATIILGRTTDTYDAEGQVVASGGRTDFERDELDQALAAFVGPIEQVPPAYSAIKRDGQPMYRLARQGQAVELEPRPVEIHEAVLLDWASPALVIEVECSSGTYIRSLAHDLGQALGSGAHLGALVRLRSGHFRLEDAASLARVEEAFEHGQGERYLLPMDEALLDWPAVVVGAGDARRIAQGQAIYEGLSQDDGGSSSLWRAYSLDGEFLAIMSYDPQTGAWQPKKVFASG